MALPRLYKCGNQERKGNSVMVGRSAVPGQTTGWAAVRMRIFFWRIMAAAIGPQGHSTRPGVFKQNARYIIRKIFVAGKLCQIPDQRFEKRAAAQAGVSVQNFSQPFFL